MEALFQIGKDLAALEARIKLIENDKCSCKDKSKGIKDANLPKEQKAVISHLRANHSETFAALNSVLKGLRLPDNLVIGRFTLMDRGRLDGTDDEDMCCICCTDGSDGYEYCCDYAGCSCCS